MNVDDIIEDVPSTPEDPYSTQSDDDPEWKLDSDFECEVVQQQNVLKDKTAKFEKKGQQTGTSSLDQFKRSSKKDQISVASSSKAPTSENEKEQLDKAESTSILDGKYFKIIKIFPEDNSIEAECQICLPTSKKIKGKLSSSSNFYKHLKRVHTDKLKEYEEYKLTKKLNRKRGLVHDTPEMESAEPKKPKLVQGTLINIPKQKKQASHNASHI